MSFGLVGEYWTYWISFSKSINPSKHEKSCFAKHFALKSLILRFSGRVGKDEIPCAGAAIEVIYLLMLPPRLRKRERSLLGCCCWAWSVLSLPLLHPPVTLRCHEEHQPSPTTHGQAPTTVGQGMRRGRRSCVSQRFSKSIWTMQTWLAQSHLSFLLLVQLHLLSLLNRWIFQLITAAVPARSRSVIAADQPVQ